MALLPWWLSKTRGRCSISCSCRVIPSNRTSPSCFRPCRSFFLPFLLPPNATRATGACLPSASKPSHHPLLWIAKLKPLPRLACLLLHYRRNSPPMLSLWFHVLTPALHCPNVQTLYVFKDTAQSNRHRLTCYANFCNALRNELPLIASIFCHHSASIEQIYNPERHHN